MHEQDVVWVIASELVARQGATAARRARERSRKLEDAGDKNGAAVWTRVAEVAERMVRPN